MADALVLGTSSERVRVRPSSPAPNQENPNLFPIGEGFGFFIFFGELNQGAVPCPKLYQKAGRGRQ